MGIEPRFGFGELVQDQVTGYSGYITAYMISDNGNICYKVEYIDTTGRPITDWIDEYRLKEVES